tara:strand:- start:35 stop:202 length:168 start_codon:yes stop_codon:yes gene_type:complete
MDPKLEKERNTESVASLLADLTAKIDTIKEKVEKLCETTGCFEAKPAIKKKESKR